MTRVLFAVLAVLLSVPAWAQPYAILGAGLAKTQAAGFTETTFPAFGGIGFRLNKSLSLEATYSDLDTGKDQRNSDQTSVLDGGGNRIVTTTRKEWKGKGPGIFVIGQHRISPSLSLVGKVGAYRLTSETSTSTLAVTFPTAGAVTSTQTDSTTSERIWSPTIGLGLQSQVREHVALRLTLEQVNGRHGDFKRSRMASFAALISF